MEIVGIDSKKCTTK